MKRAYAMLPALPLALILTVAGLNVWATLVSFLAAYVLPHGKAPIAFERLVVLRDGTVVINKTVHDGHRFIENDFRTLENKPVPEPIAGAADYPFALYPAHGAHLAFEPAPAIQPWKTRIGGYSVGGNKPGAKREFWYFVHDGLLQGSGYFVGYNLDSKTVIGYCGTKGFVEQLPPMEDRFHVAGDYLARHLQGFDGQPYGLGHEPWNSAATVRLVAVGQVIEFDFAQRRTTPVWKGEGVLDLNQLVQLPQSPSEAVLPVNRLIVRTESRLHILNKDNQEEYAVEIPESLRRKILNVWELAEGGILASTDFDPRPNVMLAPIPKTGPAKIVEVPLPNETSDSVPWPTLAVIMPSPAGLVGVWTIFGRGWQTRGQAETWSDAIFGEWPRVWPALFATLVVSVGLAVWVWRRQRQFGLGGENLWAAFVVVFGPFAALAYLFHRAWPVREACPACRVPAPRDREACFHCGAEFPGPQHLSTEIRA